MLDAAKHPNWGSLGLRGSYPCIPHMFREANKEPPATPLPSSLSTKNKLHLPFQYASSPYS